MDLTKMAKLDAVTEIASRGVGRGITYSLGYPYGAGRVAVLVENYFVDLATGARLDVSETNRRLDTHTGQSDRFLGLLPIAREERSWTAADLATYGVADVDALVAETRARQAVRE